MYTEYKNKIIELFGPDPTLSKFENVLKNNIRDILLFFYIKKKLIQKLDIGDIPALEDLKISGISYIEDNGIYAMFNIENDDDFSSFLHNCMLTEKFGDIILSLTGRDGSIWCKILHGQKAIAEIKLIHL